MAEADSMIEKGSQDFKTIEDFVNLPAGSDVYPRLLPDINVGTLSGVRDAIFEAGGLPAKPFATLAKMNTNGASLADGQLAMVYDETANNGLYEKKAGVWVKAAYDPFGFAEEYTNTVATTTLADSKLYVDSNPLFKPTILGDVSLDNIKQSGLYLQTSTAGKDLIALGYPVNNVGYLQVVSSDGTSFVVQTYLDTINRVTYSRTFGTVWSAWVSAQDFAPTANANPKFKPKLLTATDNLNDIALSGEYHKVASGDIGADKNYPVLLAGSLIVEYATVSSIIQTYTVFSTGKRYVRSKTSVWTAWQELLSSTSLTTQLSNLASLEWQQLASSEVNYDATTRTVNIVGNILAGYQTGTGRIRIADISIPMPGAYDVCFLDLNKLGTASSIDTTNYTQYLFVGSYSGAGDLQYRAKLGQVALFKYDLATARVVPCAGFVQIKYATDSSVVGATSGLRYTKASDLLSIYYDMPNGKKLYVGFKHNLVPSLPESYYQSNADLWRLYQFYRCDKDYVKELEIVNIGELELAITHTENTQTAGIAKDHVGGYHGDELLTKIDFYIDGVRKDASFTQTAISSANEVQAVQHSVIYYQNTLRPLADHVKVITFKDGVVNVKQKLDFKYEATQLTTAWVTMLPILRTGAGSVQITDKSSRSDDYYLQVDDNTTTDGFAVRYTPIVDGSKIKQWLSTGKISSETTLIKTPEFTATQNAYIANTTGYNKLYVSATEGGNLTPVTVPLNTVWEWETEYKIKC